MEKLKDILVYIFRQYESEKKFTVSRLIKIIYLIDWKKSILDGIQMSNIEWKIMNCGPNTDQVITLIKENPDIFVITETVNHYGSAKYLINLKSDYQNNSSISNHSDEDIINSVLRTSDSKPWSELLQLIYSTYPVLMSEKNVPLNLPDLASQYKLFLKQKEELDKVDSILN